MKNILYTTVTVSDFEDIEYINQLIELNIRMELALLTRNLEDLEKELKAKIFCSLQSPEKMKKL